jgi:hypothetical protein
MQDNTKESKIALWLTPEELQFLTNEWRKIPDNAEPAVKETWARIAFIASAALHKAGVKNEAVFPSESQKYLLPQDFL